MEEKRFNLVLPNTSNNKEETTSDKKNTKLIKTIIQTSSQLNGETIVIKLSSNIINNEPLLQNFINNIHLISQTDVNIIIIHDYSGIIVKTLNIFGIRKKLLDNLKITDLRTSNLLEMIISGYINKKIVSKLCDVQCNAIGISGKDCNLLEGISSNDEYINELDKVIGTEFFASPILGNPNILVTLEEANIISVISPIASSRSSLTYLLNVNMTSSIIASSIGAKLLILMEDNEIILNNYNASKGMAANEIKKLINEDKNERNNILNATYNALENNVENVKIINSKDPDSLLNSIFLNRQTYNFSNKIL